MTVAPDDHPLQFAWPPHVPDPAASHERLGTLMMELVEILDGDGVLALHESDGIPVAELELGDELFYFVPARGNGELTLYCEVVPLPPDAPAAQLRRALEWSMALASSGLGSLGIDAGSGRLSLVVRISLSATAQELFQALRHMSWHVRRWRSELSVADPHESEASA